jgi:hypothetical protein
MTPHSLVQQLRFARTEFVRRLDGASEADGLVRQLPMNSLGWMVGHMANQEHRYWVMLAQGKELVPGLIDRVGTGRPASTPPLAEMWSVWRTVTPAADEYLETLTVDGLGTHLLREGQPIDESVGTMLMRVIYHSGSTREKPPQSARFLATRTFLSSLATWTPRPIARRLARH